MGYQDIQKYLDKQHDDSASAVEDATKKESALRAALVARGWPDANISFGPWTRVADKMHGSVTVSWQGESHVDPPDRLSLDLRLTMGGEHNWLNPRDGAPFLHTAPRTQEDVVAEWLEGHVKTHIRLRFAGTPSR